MGSVIGDKPHARRSFPTKLGTQIMSLSTVVDDKRRRAQWKST
ncbi:MAG TPA: hypothetical protein PKA58_11335 [Polyangium sp.]|nr:hypothetical protein [Polyangium sp.]